VAKGRHVAKGRRVMKGRRMARGRRDGGDVVRATRRRRMRQDEARATQDEGEGDQREGNCQHLQKKTEKKVHQAAASRHAFMSGKGAAS
jgi:hypothetical protein